MFGETVITRLTSLTRFQKRALQIVADTVIIIVSFAVAMTLRLESIQSLLNPVVWQALLPSIPITILVFAKLGIYKVVIRYITGQIFSAILLGVGVSAVTLFASALVLSAPVPVSVPGIYALILFLTAGGLRLLLRQFFRRPQLSSRSPVLVYGAGDTGRQLVNALYHGQDYAPVAFIDDNPELQSTMVAGRRVYAFNQVSAVAEEMRIKTVLLAMPSIPRGRRREIVTALEPIGVEVKTIPSVGDIIAGRAKIGELRRLTPEDLLGRDPIAPRADLMGRNIEGKVVLVSGAGGSIGSELCRQIVQYGPSALILFDVSEFALYSINGELRETCAREGLHLRIEPVLGSVQNPDHVRSVMRSFRVQTVYHAAAYKHVAIVEENVVGGIRNNVFGTKVMAEAAAELKVENFILISTDKAVRPTNFMGASKRMAELVCQALAREQPRTTFSMVRFGNVLGSSGSVIPRFQAQIERGGPVTVTHREITRFFMTIPEAAQLVIQAGAMANGGDVFVLDMGEPVKILDLAQTMVRLNGLAPYIVDDPQAPPPPTGDIPINIVGLNKGEKLYEELLIGKNPAKTAHPRIMTSTEASLSYTELNNILRQIDESCHAFDVPEIIRIILASPLDYRPTAASVHDIMWNAVQAQAGEYEDSLQRLAF